MAAKGIDVPHLHCANHTAPRRRVIQNLLASFLDGRSPHTLTAYGRDLDDFARFLTGSRQAALGRFFVQPAPAANADVLRYRHELVARHLAPATINRRLVAIRSLTKLARLLGIVPWAIEVQDVPQETLRDTQGPGVETVAEMLRLAGAPRDSYSARNVAMLPVMFDLALRVSEVRQLDVADLELDRRALLWVSGKDRAEKELLSLPETTLGPSRPGCGCVGTLVTGPTLARFQQLSPKLSLPRTSYNDPTAHSCRGKRANSCGHRPGQPFPPPQRRR